MALNFNNPFVFKGDRETQLTSWRVSSFSDMNTDRGTVYVTSEVVGSDVQVSLYSDQGQLNLVAQGQGPVDSRVTLAEQNDSEFGPASVYVNGGASGTGRVLTLALASEQDLRERDDRIQGLLLDGESDFSVVLKATSRHFLTLMARRFSPHVTLGSPLRFMGGSPIVPQSKEGDPDQTSEFLWTLTGEGVFDLTGLQNPEDYREWAIYDSLSRVWRRKVRGADDPMLGVSEYYRGLAEHLWVDLVPWIDIDNDVLPDRPARIRSVRIRRG